MASNFMTAFYVLGLLTCGSLNTIMIKVAFSLSSEGSDGQEKDFQKPWFVTFIMFVAMMGSLPFDRALRRCEPCKGKTEGQVPLLPDVSPGGPGDAPSTNTGKSWLKKVLLVSMPAFFDILATGLCSMGFLYIPASVWQLLRGAEMIFAAIFAIVFLKRKLMAFHWLGLMFCVAGIILVGLASVWGESSSNGSGSSSSDSSQPGRGTLTLLFGMSLALAGQLVQAAQVIAEEWLLTDMDLPEMQIIGFEGVWGAVMMLIVAFPLFYVLPGQDGGKFEDEFDAMTMLQNSNPLLSALLVFAFSCTTYNMAGICVTGALSAVHRVMLEAFRTCIVWAFGLTVHYCYDPDSKFGEVWTPYSLLEVGGFVCLILGQAIYGVMIRIPGLKYPEGSEPEMMASPGSMRNLASPLPPDYEGQKRSKPAEFTAEGLE